MRTPSPYDQIGSGDLVISIDLLEWSKSRRLAIVSAKFVTGCTAENAGFGVAIATAAEELSLIAEGDILIVLYFKAGNCLKVLCQVNIGILVGQSKHSPVSEWD